VPWVVPDTNPPQRIDVVEEFRSVYHMTLIRFAVLSSELHDATVLDDAAGEPDPEALNEERRRGNETFWMRRKVDNESYAVTQRFLMFGASYLGKCSRRNFSL
jgi:hypothetical protein